MIQWLKGNKIYLGSIAWGLLGIAYSQEWINAATAATIGSILTGWTGVALRAAWKKGGK